MMIDALFIIVGFILLIKGADALVEGASAMAKHLGVSALVVGLTIVAFGTSMPELVVNVIAAVRGTGDLAVGTVLGSNIANIALVLGVAAVISPMKVQQNTVWREIPFALLAGALVFLMTNDIFLDGASHNAISRVDGIVLISFSLIFVYYLLALARGSRAEHDFNEDKGKFSWRDTSLKVAFGMIILVIGGKFVIDHAVSIATAFGVSQKFIGLTVVALGTSLPELATSIVAAKRGQMDIAVGNIVGSNILNVFWVLGISTTISPIVTQPSIIIDASVAMFFPALLFVAMFWGKRHELERWQGVGLLMMYVSYIGFLFVQG